MNEADRARVALKVPEVTLAFWIMKILATTLGETGGDAVTMSMHLGYAIGTLIFAAIFLAAAAFQIRACRVPPALYWFTIVATTTVGTTLADLATRDLGIGYAGGSLALFLLLMACLLVWRQVMGSVSFRELTSRKAELFYWVTIMLSQTLGTALGDWTADDDGGLGLGYGGAAIIFGIMLAVVAALYFGTRISRTILFWTAFILTRPLGAVVGDFLDKPHSKGGMELSRYSASLALAVAIVVLLVVVKHRSAASQH
jgi:uncharacterized membrane-anchored protein